MAKERVSLLCFASEKSERWLASGAQAQSQLKMICACFIRSSWARLDDIAISSWGDVEVPWSFLDEDGEEEEFDEYIVSLTLVTLSLSLMLLDCRMIQIQIQIRKGDARPEYSSSSVLCIVGPQFRPFSSLSWKSSACS